MAGNKRKLSQSPVPYLHGFGIDSADLPQFKLNQSMIEAGRLEAEFRALYGAPAAGQSHPLQAHQPTASALQHWPRQNPVVGHAPQSHEAHLASAGQEGVMESIEHDAEEHHDARPQQGRRKRQRTSHQLDDADASDHDSESDSDTHSGSASVPAHPSHDSAAAPDNTQPAAEPEQGCAGPDGGYCECPSCAHSRARENERPAGWERSPSSPPLSPPLPPLRNDGFRYPDPTNPVDTGPYFLEGEDNFATTPANTFDPAPLSDPAAYPWRVADAPVRVPPRGRPRGSGTGRPRGRPRGSGRGRARGS